MRTAIISLFLAALAAGVVRGQPQITLEAATDRSLYSANSRSTAYVEARIHPLVPPGAAPAPEPPAAIRNIVFVLDRSGSMAGEPIQALRHALVAALNSLSDRDVVSVVLFGSEVETAIEAQRRDKIGDLDRVLAQMEPAGGAALYDALNQGAAQLRRSAGPGTINHLVLVTDGPPTKGPREFDDFSRLAGVFAQEGMTISTIGLGREFNEDLLAALARIGNGRFRYIDQPGKLVDALQAEIAPLRSLRGREAVLTIEFKPICENVTSYGWEPAAIDRDVVTYRFPYVFAGQDLSVLASTELSPRRVSCNLATVSLRWKDAAGDATHEITTALSVVFDGSHRAVRESGDPAVIRTAVNKLISEGMQEAIEKLDKGDFRGALRALRHAREDAMNFNDDLDDPQITARIKQLEAYLAEVQARGLNQLDRKILRSGLYNQFETPTAEEHPDD
jgi:Ca-activated chloride channel family protein